LHIEDPLNPKSKYKLLKLPVKQHRNLI